MYGNVRLHFYKNSNDSNGEAIQEKRLHRFNQLISVHLISPLFSPNILVIPIWNNPLMYGNVVSTKITKL